MKACKAFGSNAFGSPERLASIKAGLSHGLHAYNRVSRCFFFVWGARGIIGDAPRSPEILGSQVSMTSAIKSKCGCHVSHGYCSCSEMIFVSQMLHCKYPPCPTTSGRMLYPDFAHTWSLLPVISSKNNQHSQFNCLDHLFTSEKFVQTNDLFNLCLSTFIFNISICIFFF
jgi:hypothetical protein